ncbi:MAG: tyrosine-protein phosphatase [Candidatus Nanopelagicales bacterium]
MSLRMDIEGTHNFRDVGGYPAGRGVTRPGQLFRSDALGGITPAGSIALRKLGISVVIDLRSRLEAAQDKSVHPLPEALIVRVPIHGGSRSSFVEDGHISLESLYRQVLLDSAWSLTAAVSMIAESCDRPVLVHCTAGKDRTGLVVALTLEAVGVDRSAVIADYTQSALNLDGEWIDRTVTTLLSRGVPISPRLFEVLGGAPDHAMSRILNWLDKQYGSAAEFLFAHGMGEDAVDSLRSKLVD